jgi:WD40 repeat protein
LLASGGEDRIVRLWSVKDGRATQLASLPCNDHILSLSFRPDGRVLAIATWDGEVILEDLVRLLHWSSRDVSSLGPPLSGRHGSQGPESGEETPEKIILQGHVGQVHRVVFTPDGRRVATAGGDHMVKIWDSRTGQQLLQLDGAREPMHALAFSSDGRLLATAGENQIIHVWSGSAKTPDTPAEEE